MVAQQLKQATHERTKAQKEKDDRHCAVRTGQEGQGVMIANGLFALTGPAGAAVRGAVAHLGELCLYAGFEADGLRKAHLDKDVGNVLQGRKFLGQS